MRVNSMYTSIPNDNINPLLKKNVKFSGAKNDNAEINKNKNDREKTSNNNVFFSQSSKDDLIKNLQEQIERIKKDDKLDAKSKKVKIEDLQKQIDEIEQADNKKKLDEMSKALLGDTEKLAEKRKAKAEKEAREKGSDLNVSINGMTNLINAEQKLEQAQELKVLKAKKEAEETLAKREIEFDEGFQSAQLAVRKEEKMAFNAAAGKENDFNGEFVADVSDKRSKLEELSGIIDSIDEAINSAIGKANKEVDGAKDKADEKTKKTDKTKEEEAEKPQDSAIDAANELDGQAPDVY